MTFQEAISKLEAIQKEIIVTTNAILRARLVEVTDEQHFLQHRNLAFNNIELARHKVIAEAFDAGKLVANEAFTVRRPDPTAIPAWPYDGLISHGSDV